MNEVIKQRIIEFNNKFGIKTEFVTNGDVLGYALGNTIYINESIDQDYEKTNRHELLHFYEETQEFEEIKQRLLKEHKEELEEIRSEYELRYFGLYSEEEIKAGALDTEIVIDMMVDNSSFEYEDGLKIGDDFLGQIQHSIEEKKYLNLSLNANIKNMNLSDWEKIFVLNYYDGKERKLPQGKDKVQLIRADIEKYLKELYGLDESAMKIDSNSPEVIREYESEIKALKARGENTALLELNPERCCQEIAEKISEQLYAEYIHIVDLMKGLDIEPAFKSIMLRETLTKVYKLDRDKESKEGKTIVKNRKLNESIAGHMILNETTLKIIYENIKNIDEYKNFANLYFAAIEIYKKTISQKSGIILDGVDTYGKGIWLKFDGKETDEEHYLDNSKKLAALVQDTPWCTKKLASSQLAEGDFYVFVDNDGKPHIAVKMSGNAIDEVRGIENGSAQDLEEEYREVAISFLENNKNIQNGKEWLKKEEWNKRLIEYKKKIDRSEFTVEDVPALIEDCFYVSDYRSHREENLNKKALMESLEKIRGVLAEYYKCNEDEIAIGDIRFEGGKLIKEYTYGRHLTRRDRDNIKTQSSCDETTRMPYKIIFGDVNFKGSKITDLDQLQYIVGDAVFSQEIIDLGQLQYIGGNAGFRRAKIKDLRQLQYIGGSAQFSFSEITNLGQLQYIGGDAIFDSSKITHLGQLRSIGGSIAYFDKSKIIDIGNLQYIGGSVTFYRKDNSPNIVGTTIEILKELVKRRKTQLSSQDIGMAGFGVDVNICDIADAYINKQLEQDIERTGENNE